MRQCPRLAADKAPCSSEDTHLGGRLAPGAQACHPRRLAPIRGHLLLSALVRNTGKQQRRCHATSIRCTAARENATGVSRCCDDRSLVKPASASAVPAPAPAVPSPAVAAASGGFLGAVSLISTNTIGAGILALPATSAQAGFVPSAAVLVTVWALLTMDAFLIAEVNIAVREERAAGGDGDDGGNGIVTLRQMAATTLGPWGASAVSVVYLFIAFSLLVAYDSKVGEILGSWGLGITPLTGAAAFSGAMAAIISAGPGLVVNLSRGSMVGMLGLYGIIMLVGAERADWADIATSDWSHAASTIPILLLALVYHDLIPVVVTLLKGDRRTVRSALLLGSLAPLAMFLGWNLVALAQPHPMGAELMERWDPVQQLIEGGSASAGTAVVCFSLLAIMTSFLGAALGLTATLATEFRAASLSLKGAVSAGKDKLLPAITEAVEVDADDVLGKMGPGIKVGLLAVSLGPPLLICSQNPDAFFGMLEVAGGYGMTALYGVMPPIMAWRLRASRQAGHCSVPSSEGYPALVPGGNAVLALLACCATTVELGRLAVDSGITPATLGEVGQAANEALAQMAMASPATLWLQPWLGIL